MKAKARIDLWLPYQLAQEIDEYKKGKEMTSTLIELIQLGLTIMKNRQNFQDPQFIESIIQNITSDKIDKFFDELEPKTLEAMYVFSKSEMEKRYGKSRLDKFV